MAAQTYALDRKSRMFAANETTFGTAADHAGTDVLPHAGQASITFDIPESEFHEKRAQAGVVEFIREGANTIAWSYPESALKPSGAAGTEPDLAPLLKQLLGVQGDGVASPETVTPGSTTTSVVVASAGGSVGCPLRFTGNFTSALADEVTFVTSVSGNTYTVSPPLTTPPSSTDTLYVGYGWSTSTDPSNSLSLFGEMAHTLVGASGCIANSGTFKIAQNGRLTFGASGSGCGKFSVVGTSALSAGINNSVTSMAVTSGDGRKFLIDSSVPMYATIEAEGANTAETVKISAGGGSSDSLTIARAQKSTSASAHGSGAVVVPWSPTVTKYGNPLSGRVGTFKIGTSVSSMSAFNMHDFSLGVENGESLRQAEYGTTYSGGYFRSGHAPRKLDVSINCKLTKDVLIQWGRAVGEVNVSLWLKVGGTALKQWFFFVPSLRMKIVPLQAGDADEAMYSLSGAVLEATENQSVYIGTI